MPESKKPEVKKPEIKTPEVKQPQGKKAPREKTLELIGRVEKFTGPEAVKPAQSRGNSTVMQKALKEIQEETEKETQAVLKNYALDAIKLTHEVKKIMKQYDDNLSKVNKELEKVVGRIENLMAGRAIVEEEEKDEK